MEPRLATGSDSFGEERSRRTASGANVNLVESLTVGHPLETERDAENYNAVLGQMSMRMDEAIALSMRQAARNIIPPKFILEATIRQMQSFADYAPAQNPLATTLGQKAHGH